MVFSDVFKCNLVKFCFGRKNNISKVFCLLYCGIKLGIEKNPKISLLVSLLHFFKVHLGQIKMCDQFATNCELTMDNMRLIAIKYLNRLTARSLPSLQVLMLLVFFLALCR